VMLSPDWADEGCGFSTQLVAGANGELTWAAQSSRIRALRPATVPASGAPTAERAGINTRRRRTSRETRRATIRKGTTEPTVSDPLLSTARARATSGGQL
jgi:hypothetical protein